MWSKWILATAAGLSCSILLSACGSAPVGPGYYRVTRGDTLSTIARRQGQSTANLVRWNRLSNPNEIDVGQVLRVAPPAGSNTGVRTASATDTTAGGAPAAAPSRSSPAPAMGPVTPPAASTISLAWPASGALLAGFDGRRNKGIDIAGQIGDTVSAAAPGQVAYVGQLRGYGNLLIIKHSNGFLTSYAHLQRMIVREGQTVTQNQTVATIGDTEAPRPMLHFELRYNGQPVDPARYLPAR